MQVHILIWLSKLLQQKVELLFSVFITFFLQELNFLQCPIPGQIKVYLHLQVSTHYSSSLEIHATNVKHARLVTQKQLPIMVSKLTQPGSSGQS